ncbi:MAG: tRNA (adenosine(37)-N6)-threonylcarbamoyltransferase complex dimerization subunit type 1 TsaB [Melioribacteraceae bacterium]|nr:tRNA (adenosine(37)-N6)-threonylcarbamoyltransferase complex dimerization subunit type 1 TsaB [Melioribacteraceae bacterium]
MSKTNLPILSIETSGGLCSTALLISPEDYFEISISQRHVHSKKLLSLVDDLLLQAGLTLDEIKGIAVSMGPGSFTGLRIGLSSAKGLAFGSGLPLIPVPTFDALAYQILSMLNEEEFAVANKVNTEEIYFAKYKCNLDGKPVESGKIKLINKGELSQLTEDFKVFGDAAGNQFSSPNAWAVAKWAYLFGKDLVTSDYDLLEPTYLKEFKIKVKK